MVTTQTELKDRYFTKAEAAAYLRCSLRQIDYLVHRGAIRAFQPDKKILFRQSDLDGWVERHERKPQRRGEVVA